jgi:hypothetical protein
VVHVMNDCFKITSISLRTKNYDHFNFDVGLEADNFGGSYLQTQRSWQPQILVLAAAYKSFTDI